MIAEDADVNFALCDSAVADFAFTSRCHRSNFSNYECEVAAALFVYIRRPYQSIGCRQESGLTHTAQWWTDPLSQFDTNQSTRLDALRTCTREQAISFVWNLAKAEHYDHRYRPGFGFSSFDRYPNIRFYLMKTLQRHDNHRWKQIVLWHLHDLAPIMSLCSGADPTYDERQSRRRRLNAPQRREDSSQCSGSRERERRNRILLGMALVVILIGKNNGVRATIQS